MKKEEINTLLNSANNLVAELTSYKVPTRRRRNAKTIAEEYIDNAFAVKQLLQQRGITPIL